MDDKTIVFNNSHVPGVNKYIGLYFEQAEDVDDYLRYEKEFFDSDEELLSYTEQADQETYRTHVLITNKRMAIVTSRENKVPQVVLVNNVKSCELDYEETPVQSVLIVKTRKNKYIITKLPPGDARRLHDIVKILKLDKLETPDRTVPSNLAFEGVYPIEYYEAMIGPNGKREVQTVDHMDHRFVLNVVTGDKQGYFIIDWFRKRGEQYVQVKNTPFKPFRSNALRLIRENEKPYQIQVYPASDETPMGVLGKHNIRINDEALTIKERYQYVKQVSPLNAMKDILKTLGFRETENASDTRGFQHLKTRNHQYLHINGKSYTFDRFGQPVNTVPLHWQDQVEVLIEKKPKAQE